MQVESSQGAATSGQAAKEDPWQQKTSLMLEGGGTRGFASLLMLRELMRTIERIEKEYPNDPHNSSFGPDAIDGNGAVQQGDDMPIQALKPAVSEPPPNRRVFSSRTLTFGRNNGEENKQKQEERRQKTRAELERRDVFLPCHYFDYIAGTSTGGLNALMLGRLRMSVDECIERYPKIAQNVFGRKRRSLGGAWRARYDCTYLEKEMNKLVNERMPDNAGPQWSIFKSPDDLCRTVLVAKAIDEDGNSGEPYLFRSYDHNFHNIKPKKFTDHHLNPGPANDCQIWQAGRATSAAPGYLDEIKIGDRKFSDGAIGHNDPSELVYWEMLIKEGHYDERSSGQSATFPISLVLTLGTGLRPTKRDRAKGLLAKQKHLKRLNNILSQMIHQTTSSKGTEEHMESQAKHHKFKYWKWSGGDVVGGLKLDECKDDIFTSMKEWIENYTSQESVKKEIRQCAELLVRKRRERYQQTQDRWRRFTFCTNIKCLMCPRDDFGTRDEVMQHITRDHEQAKDKPIKEILDLLEEKPPWTLRGPFSHHLGKP